MRHSPLPRGSSHRRHRSRPDRIKHRAGVEEILQELGIIVHPVAVQISSALPEVAVADLHEIFTGIHITVIIVAHAFQILELISGIVLMDGEIRAEGKNDDICSSYQRIYIILKFLRIRLEMSSPIWPTF